MNNLINTICDKYGLSPDIQELILNEVQRALFKNGWNYLYRPENVKYLKKYKKYSKTPLKHINYGYNTGRSYKYNINKDVCNDVFILLNRDICKKTLIKRFECNHNIRNKLEKHIYAKRIYPFSEGMMFPIGYKLECQYNMTREKLKEYIDNYTEYSYKKSYSKTQLIRIIISGNHNKMLK